jgi:murein DD-endopeptidase MepM/ murein hydrolase activator NlpD
LINSSYSVPGYYHRNIEEYRGRNDPDALKAVAKEMEALFVYELIKAMRQTATEETKTSLGKDTYMGMFDMELARLLSERGLGLQEMLLKTLNNRTSEPNTKDETTSEIQTEISEPGSSSLLSEPDPGLLSLPVHGVISSPFGMRKHPIFGDNRFHTGVDIAAPVGTEVHPIRRGRVIFSGEQAGYGNVVVIDHGDGLISKYAHNKTNLVKEGEQVDANTVIAQVGYTGNSTGPHLHLEIRDEQGYIDPVTLLARG